MPTPKTDPRLLAEAVQAYALYQDKSKAARALGIPRETLRRRLDNASKGLSEVVAPALPEQDEPLDQLIDRLIESQERETEYRRATEWMRFDISGSEPFALVFVGDPHVDTCDIKALRDDCELIAETPRMWAVGLGDYANQWVGRLQSKYGHQEVTQKNSYRLVEWLFGLPIWMLLILGNHDGMRWHGHGSPLRWMQNASPVPLQDWQAKFSLRCGSKEWRVWAAHDFPGNSMWNPLHGPSKRAQVTGATADLFIAGDHHTYALGHTQHEHTGKPYWVARARGYKPLDDYALEKGYGEQDIGRSIGAVFDPSTGKMNCFGDVGETARYLRSISKRRAA